MKNHLPFNLQKLNKMLKFILEKNIGVRLMI